MEKKIISVDGKLSEKALSEAYSRLRLERYVGDIQVLYSETEGHSCSFDGKVLKVKAPGKYYVFRALLHVALRKGKSFSAEETRAFREHGIMLDCSRNAVLTTECVKKYILILALLGYNTLQLYTEDTYEIEGEPYFGYLRGRYSKNELKELSAYAASFGILLIPCIQTLAHLKGIFRWNEYAEINDIGDILLAEDNRTYELIEKMFDTVAECFQSKIVNIGMDEAFLLGLGKYRCLHGVQNRTDILLKHLEKVVSIARRHGLDCAMWSDMFYRLAFNSYYTEKESPFDKDILEKIPEGLRLIYWDYYTDNYARMDSIIKQHRAMEREVWYAGGAWVWMGFLPDNRFSVKSLKVSTAACRDNGISHAFLTLWGDNGGECSVFAALPAIVYGAELAYGEENEGEIARVFKLITGTDISSFFLLDSPDQVGNYLQAEFSNPTKYLLYSDCFAGFYDSLLQKNDSVQFREISRKLARIRGGEWSYIFSYVRSLCDVMEIKYSIGIRTRELYRSGNRQELKEFAKKDYGELITRISAFYRCFKRAWESEKRQNGFEVHDIRIGGLLQRVKDCRDTLLRYCEGKVEKIAQLEENILDYFGQEDCKKQTAYINDYLMSSSVNFI